MPYSKREKFLSDFLRNFTVINGFIVDKKIFDYNFQCSHPGCGYCCAAGTCVTNDEIQRIHEVIEDIKKYLSESKVTRLNDLHNHFYAKHLKKGLWRLRTWNSSCIFLMEDKRCAVHRYCTDNNLNWIKFHFNRCVTYPLNIIPEDNFIQIAEELFDRGYKLPCFKLAENATEQSTRPLIYSMKAVISDRLGAIFWKALEKEYMDSK